jgi:hypothetical protein
MIDTIKNAIKILKIVVIIEIFFKKLYQKEEGNQLSTFWYKITNY